MKKVILSVALILQLGFVVSCQSNAERTADDILRPCFDLFDKGDLVDGGRCIEQTLYENPNRAEELSERASSHVFAKCVEIKNKEDYRNAIICLKVLRN